MTCGKLCLILLCSFLGKTRPRPWRRRPAAKRANREQAVCKPGSVTGPEGPADGHSSGTPVAGRLARSTRARRPGMRLPPLFDLAPGGVCPAAAIAGGAVRSYRTLSPLPRRAGGAVCSLWHFPWGRPRRGLPGTVFPWSPDFPPAGGGRPSVRLVPARGLAPGGRWVNGGGWIVAGSRWSVRVGGGGGAWRWAAGRRRALRPVCRRDAGAPRGRGRLMTAPGGTPGGGGAPRRRDAGGGACPFQTSALPGGGGAHWASRAARRAVVSPSARPSTRQGRKWRWKARTTVAVPAPKRPSAATA